MLPAPLQPKLFSAFEYRGRTEGGVTRPYRIGARDSHGRSVNVIVKVRNPEAATGHHAGTSLACELTFAILARALGLSVPDYGIVDIGEPFARTVSDGAAEQNLLRNVGQNFASEFLPQRQPWLPRCNRTTGELRQAIDDVLSFDASIFNADRTSGNPNLLWDGRDVVHAIDHSLACPANRWTDEQITESPFLPDDRVQKHCGFTYLRNFGAPFSNVTERWQSLATEDFWRDLREIIPERWCQGTDDLDRIFRFLRERVTRLTQVSDHLRRIVR